MTWPTPATTTSLDADTDTLQDARPEVKGLADKFNLLVAHVTSFMQSLLSSADAAAARTTLDVPSKNGAGATGTSWGIGITGNAATATTAANVTRSVTGAGLASGGGALTADRAITVPKASQAQAEAGVDDATAMTPLRTRQAIATTAIGVGQTWQDLTASRSAGVTYTNSTGRPIAVAITTSNTNATTSFFVDTVQVGATTHVNGYSNSNQIYAEIPSGSSYNLVGARTKWAELR